VLETEKETSEDGRCFTILDVVSYMNNGQESNVVSSQSQVSACTEINLSSEAMIEGFFLLFCHVTM
jgi:hypothetical protein